MKQVISNWIEPSDGQLVNWIKLIGVRELSRQTKISASMMSRWLRGQTGMSAKLVSRVEAVVAEYKTEILR